MFGWTKSHFPDQRKISKEIFQMGVNVNYLGILGWIIPLVLVLVDLPRVSMK